MDETFEGDLLPMPQSFHINVDEPITGEFVAVLEFRAGRIFKAEGNREVAKFALPLNELIGLKESIERVMEKLKDTLQTRQ